MPYCALDDLVKIRPNVQTLGVTDSQIEDFIDETDSIVERAIESRWYRDVAHSYGLDPRETLFDPSLLLNADPELTRLACYKTLELFYTFVTKDTPEEDGFERQRKLFAKKYNDELEEVLAAGLSYDWDESGDIDEDEERQIDEDDRIYRR
jgi:hypothetical protein